MEKQKTKTWSELYSEFNELHRVALQTPPGSDEHKSLLAKMEVISNNVRKLDKERWRK